MLRTSRIMTAALGALLLLTLTAGEALAQEQLIGEVTVEGNDYVAREPVLDAVKDILKVGDVYSDENAQKARDVVMRMGYFDDVTTSVQQIEGGGVRVVITVVEKQRLTRVMFAGNTVLTDEELGDVVLSQPGHVVDQRAIRRDVARIVEAYEKRGYIAHVAEAGVDAYGVLTFVIDEARIEDIVIEGLKRTQDFVVRREIDPVLKPGQLFQQGQVTTALRRVYALGLFEPGGIETEIRPGKIDPVRGIILVIKLKEAKTGKAAAAVGYSSLDKMVFMVSASENNLRGRAERASVSVELGGRRTYEFSFFEPYLTNDGTTLQLNLYDSERRRQFISGAAISTAEDQFDERRTGGDISVAKPLTDRRSLSLMFRSVEVSSSFLQGTVELPSPAIGTAQTVIRHPTGREGAIPPPDNPNLNPDNPGPGDIVGPVVVAAPLHPGGRVSSLTLGLTDDTRDLRNDPTSGGFMALSYEQAGSFLGGNTTFGKAALDYRRYFAAGIGDDVIAMRLLGGWSIGDPPLYEAFSVGGANTLRGYDVDRWRGDNMALFSTEYRHPITEKLVGVAFVDVGDAFGGVFDTPVPGFRVTAEDTEFNAHVGYGAGVRVKTPLGPIRLDLGFGEEGSQAHFSFGHTF